MRDHGAVTVSGTLLCCLVLGARGIAAAPIEDPGLRSLVEAERAFARLSVEKGMQAAFLANLAADAVIFRPGPVPAVAWFREQGSSSGTLEWAPDFAAIAVRGDLGYTSGPWSYRDRPADEPVTGHFVSIWRHAEGGAWKVVLDTGIRHEPVTASDEVSPGRSGVGQSVAGGDARAVTLQMVVETERKLAAEGANRGRLAAIRAHAADDIRMYLPGEIPAIGRAAVRSLDARQDGTIEWTQHGSSAAQAGDLAYVYGTALRHPKGAAADSVAATSFVRIWRRTSDGDFEIVLDVSAPMPVSQAQAEPTSKP